jgi:hypothetical protein
LNPWKLCDPTAQEQNLVKMKEKWADVVVESRDKERNHLHDIPDDDVDSGMLVTSGGEEEE